MTYRRRYPLKRKRRYKRRRLNLGVPIKKPSLTRSYVEENTDFTNKALGRVHSVELFNIPKGSSFSTFNNQRSTDNVIIKGVRIMKYIQNPSSSTELMVHIALVTARLASPTTTDFDDGGIGWEDEFFRSYGTPVRATDFDQTTPSTCLSAWEINTNPINSDRFIVHKRWSRLLAKNPNPTTSDFPQPHGKHHWVFNKYIKIHRQLEFHHAEDNSHDNRTFLIYWMDNPQRNEGIALTGLGINHSQRIITFFKDKAIS